jgi:hypothetical protein
MNCETWLEPRNEELEVKSQQGKAFQLILSIKEYDNAISQLI